MRKVRISVTAHRHCTLLVWQLKQLCFTFHTFVAFFSSNSFSLQKTQKTGKSKKGKVFMAVLFKGFHAQVNLENSMEFPQKN